MSEKPPLIIKTLDHVEWKPLPQSVPDYLIGAKERLSELLQPSEESPPQPAEREGMDNAFRKAFEEMDRRITQESPPQPADEPKTITWREFL